MQCRIASAAMCMALGLCAVSSANADVVTGTYNPRTDIGSATTGTGPWQLTTTASTFSVLQFDVNENFTFGELTNLSVDYTSILGGGGGGAPRLGVRVDFDLDGVISAGDKSFNVHLGTAPSFGDSVATLNALSGMNLLNNDPGRYELGPLGGDAADIYDSSAVGAPPGQNGALQLAGHLRVLRITQIGRAHV